MRDTQKQLSDDVLAVGRIRAVPLLLQVLCDVTGLGFASVARVTLGEWTACAVRDLIGIGVRTGDRIDVDTTLCCEVRATGKPIFFDQASAHPLYCTHPTPKLFGIESYVSVPIVLGDGDHFGNLCAFDRKPRPVSQPKTIAMFTRFAQVIAEQLDLRQQQPRPRKHRRAKPAADDGRELFLSLLGQDLQKPLKAARAQSRVLEKRTKDPQSLEALARISGSLGALSTSVDDLRDFARGRLGISLCGPFADCERLEELLADVVRDARMTHPNCTLISNVNVRSTVCCDPQRLRQLAATLVEHALSQGQAPGTASLIVNVEADELVIEVWHGGDPIPAEALQKIFTPLGPAAPHTGRRPLGLHLCELIVKAHRGTLQVVSSSTMGTQFVARVPVSAG